MITTKRNSSSLCPKNTEEVLLLMDSQRHNEWNDVKKISHPDEIQKKKICIIDAIPITIGSNISECEHQITKKIQFVTLIVQHFSDHSNHPV